jgi:hypothetical protein
MIGIVFGHDKYFSFFCVIVARNLMGSFADKPEITPSNIVDEGFVRSHLSF